MRSDAQFPLTLEAQLQALATDGEVLGYTAAREAPGRTTRRARSIIFHRPARK